MKYLITRTTKELYHVDAKDIVEAFEIVSQRTRHDEITWYEQIAEEEE